MIPVINQKYLRFPSNFSEMGCCLSKNDPCSQSIPSVSLSQQNNSNNIQTLSIPTKVEHTKNQIAAIETNPNPKKEQKIGKIEEERANVFVPKKKKEVFIIQHRKSSDKRFNSDGSVSNSSNSGDPDPEPEEIGRNILAAAASGQVVRTSSCTKEEVDAILIQCGRLSRSSSGNGNNGGHRRRYSGSKRSFDYDRENELVDDSISKGNGNEIEGSYEEDDRSRRRQSRGSLSHSRRSTPSRSREREYHQQQRSGSRERNQSNGRRVSRSPGRRSESPMAMNHSSSGNGKPGKLVSVPAMTMEKSNNGNGNGGDGNVKRVLVKRNVGSPRSQSPARAISPAGAHSPSKGGNVNGNQLVSLSRNGSRKAEISPYRRTPLNEIDINSLPFHPLSNKKAVQKGKEIEEDIVIVKQPSSYVSKSKFVETNNGKLSAQGTHRRTGSKGTESYEDTKTNYCRVNEIQALNVEKIESSEYDATGTDTLKLPPTFVRSRSARRSRELDINVEALLAPNPATNYNSLLLQDIQNFHQKKSSNNANSNARPISHDVISSKNESGTPFALPACVSKARSILEAVADLNSATRPANSSNPKSPRGPNFDFHNVNKRVESSDPFVQSDDLMEPSLHKYVTVRKRGGEMGDEESSGSNSFMGGSSQQNWVSSSTWEPTSAESTDCWTSKSYSREEFSPVGFQRHAISDFACGINDEESEKIFSKGLIPTSKAAAASM
ncbi:uncharacterized protein At1g65710-like isoform X2 [Amaranthus tricolor]|uniref:uncharacterized protein At1g65710-like isoform X2 n=1 Tax=Amaranthus tricolor TaxID=29722 RepID=UPI00258D3262|nr:uncharacterized protein At1g65710-like isoform X2 [Amaranthus tricolor]